MGEQSYPYSVHIYKGENRFCIIPTLKYFAGYHIDSDWYKMFDYTAEKEEIGKSILEALDVIDNSPIITKRSEETAWKKSSKYKSWQGFSKHNVMIMLDQLEDKSYDISPYSGEKSWHVLLPETATAEEIGKAISDMFDELEKMGVKKLYQ